MEYKTSHQPGCGGCLLIAAVLILLTGGFPALFHILDFLLLAGLFALVVIVGGFWAFSYYVKSRISKYEASQTETHNRFVYLMVHILVKIAQADGHFTRAELQTMLNFFQHNLRYNQDQMYWVKQIIKDARHSEHDLNELLGEFRTSFAYEPRLLLLELIYQILYTSGPPSDEELRLARSVASFLQITAYDQQVLEAKYMYRGRSQSTTFGTTSEEGYYATLGLDKSADMTAVKKAYRTLSMQYHPDKVGHLGEEFQRVAEEKMKEINSAYDYFKKKYNNG